MADWPTRLTPLDRFLGRFTRMRPGEGRSVALFFGYALLMMFSYYILKTIREPLLLTGSSAAMKSYATAATAVLLLFVVPLYGLAFRHTAKLQLTRYLTLFFVVNLLLFFLAGRAGLDIGFAYFVWVGIFNLMITAQFWAFAANSYNVKSGQRLFPLIMVGATLGGLLAPVLAGTWYPMLGPWVLMLIAAGLLALTVPFVGWSRQTVPPGSRSLPGQPGERAHGGALGGFSLVLTDRYLFLLALMILLLNWVNTTGEYILAEGVVRQAEAQAALLAGAAADTSRADFIAAFYGRFFFTVNLLTLLVQLFLVARIIHRIGVGGALLVLPLVSLAGYGLIAFLPVFSLIRVVKFLENSTNYSLMNTARHALFLPLTRAEKYEGKTAIETFFWRFGDLLQAGAIYAGLNWLQFDIARFALLNAVLALAWLFVAWRLAAMFRQKEEAMGANQPPQIFIEPEPRYLAPGAWFDFELSADTFLDADPGDVVAFTAHTEDAEVLPGWLHFDPESLSLRGKVPVGIGRETVLRVRATDFDGAWAEARLVLRHRR
jgi:AAA family ATP:ADP antiporter